MSTGPAFRDDWLPEVDDGDSVPLGRPAIAIKVYRVTPGSVPSEDTVEELTSVACLAIEKHVGPVPDTALFRYKFDGRDPQSPQTVEQALGTQYTSEDFPHLIEVGDELAVTATKPSGEEVYVFHGRPLTWSMKLDRETEAVSIAATGIAKDCWSAPFPGALTRATDKPETVKDYMTDLVARFNPKGLANATPATADAGSDPKKYPTFLDPTVTGTDSEGGEYPRAWDLAMAVAHVLYVGNDEKAVASPKRSDLDDLLVSRVPIDGVPFDPDDSSTYTARPIQAPDVPLTDKPWPVLVHEMIRDGGFEMTFDVSGSPPASPTNELTLFLKQAGTPVPLLLQPPGSRLDPARSNLAAVEAGRDLAGVVNRWRVVGGMGRYEASLVLAPGFPSKSADAASADAMTAFDKADPAFATSEDHDAYRLWVFDEDGSGHYPNNAVGSPGPTAKVSGTPTSLDDVLGAPSGDPPGPQYVARRRPVVPDLLSVDASGRPLKYRLAVSTDYAGAYPAVWDGTGHWQNVAGGFVALKDRLGVYVNITHPNAWYIGASEVTGDTFRDGKLNAVERVAAPTSDRPAFFLRLTCCLDGDKALAATADRQDTSPVPNAVTRVVDARDRLFVRKIAAHSEFNLTADAVTARDDSLLAEAEAVASRTATEAGVMEGQAVIDRFTAAYLVGDRVEGITGRGLGFRTDTGGAGFAPVLPIVTSLRWELARGQRTVLTISDAGLDRRRYARRWTVPPDVGSKHARAVLAGASPAALAFYRRMKGGKANA